MKIATINQSDLDSSCWLIQFWGREFCRECEYNGGKECGASFGNAEKIKEGKRELRSKPLNAEKKL